jgi:hypothetical protein
MKKSVLLKRIQERQFSAHHMLIRAAQRAKKSADDQAKGWLYDEVAVMVFSALAIEALANSIGERVVPDWGDFEYSPPVTKLRVLAERLGVDFKRDAEPWSTAIWLFKLRNQIAHAKPEVIIEEKILTEEEFERREFEGPPKSKLEKQIGGANAARALNGVEKIKDLLIGKMTPEQTFGLVSDGWSGRTTPHDE